MNEDFARACLRHFGYKFEATINNILEVGGPIPPLDMAFMSLFPYAKRKYRLSVLSNQLPPPCAGQTASRAHRRQ